MTALQSVQPATDMVEKTRAEIEANMMLGSSDCLPITLDYAPMRGTPAVRTSSRLPNLYCVMRVGVARLIDWDTQWQPTASQLDTSLLLNSDDS